MGIGGAGGGGGGVCWGGGGGWVHAVLYCVLNPSPSPVKTFQTQLVLLIFKDSQDFSRFFCAVLNIIDQKRG